MFIELKTHNAEPKEWQKIAIGKIHEWLRKGILKDPEWNYKGYHLITLEKESPSDGGILFDNKPVTEDQLIDRLSI